MFTKITLSILSLLSLPALAMTSLPTGSYNGNGEWKAADGTTGQYTVQVQIANNQVSSVYNFNGQSITFTYQAVLDSHGFFPVNVAGQAVGSGYCFDVQCHYSLNWNGLVQEESLTFYQSHFYRTGSKTDNGKTVVWEEDLVLGQ